VVYVKGYIGGDPLLEGGNDHITNDWPCSICHILWPKYRPYPNNAYPLIREGLWIDPHLGPISTPNTPPFGPISMPLMEWGCCGDPRHDGVVLIGALLYIS
jgi:hypothetical protein